jgi:hypothetical protein
MMDRSEGTDEVRFELHERRKIYKPARHFRLDTQYNYCVYSKFVLLLGRWNIKRNTTALLFSSCA